MPDKSIDEKVIIIYEVLQGDLKAGTPGLVHVVAEITEDLHGTKGALNPKDCIFFRMSKVEDDMQEFKKDKSFAKGWIAGIAFVSAIVGGLLVKLLFK